MRYEASFDSQTIGTHQKEIQWTLVPNLVNVLHFTFTQVILFSQLQQHHLVKKFPLVFHLVSLEVWEPELRHPKVVHAFWHIERYSIQ